MCLPVCGASGKGSSARSRRSSDFEWVHRLGVCHSADRASALRKPSSDETSHQMLMSMRHSCYDDFKIVSTFFPQ
eukprot:1630464-Prymnesium_polylepis.2